MPLLYNPDLKERSTRLRNNMTDGEKLMWSKLRMGQLGGLQFNRQKPIGDYIVDFFCHKANLVIEVDGGQHFSDEQIDNDKLRDEYLTSLGLKVLRFSNNDVMTNIEGVVERILENVKQNPP